VVKAARSLPETDGGEYLRKPPWLKIRLPGTKGFSRVRDTLARHGLHSICQEARCPNMAECFQDGTATFLLMGDVCTRDCRYCNVKHGIPGPVDPGEIPHLVEAVEYLNLKYAVITSVDRDDLPDGGAAAWAETIRAVRRAAPETKVEVLVGDFKGCEEDLATVLSARPDILAHNLETVPRLHRIVRPQARYERSLEVLARAKTRGFVTKSSLMLGLGETEEEVIAVLRDLRAVDCDIATFGQYLQPTRDHLPVERFWTPEEFARIAQQAEAMGFWHVESGPLVRSSYHAERAGRRLPEPGR